jgi:hypothetical protein
MQYQSVRAVASRLKSQFKIDMTIDDVVMACADALKKMGMIALVRSAIVARVENFQINLPGNIFKVRGVIQLSDVPDDLRVHIQDIYFPPQTLFMFEENDASAPAPVQWKDNHVAQFKGPYISHVWDAPYLRFNEDNILVGIEANGIKVDNEGYPMIPEAAFFGCLYYALFVYYQPLFLLGQVPPQTMAQVEKWKNDNVAQANSNLILESLTSNERNELFDIMTSMNRKSFGYPV